MDLDNIKKTWSSLEKSSSVEESKIEKILKNEGKDALSRLIRYEKIFLWLLLPCLGFEILLYKMHYLIAILYGIILIISFFWQRHKILHLKNINLIKMNILNVSKSINRYRKYIYWEVFAGLLTAIIFLAGYTFIALPEILPEGAKGEIRLIGVFIISLILFVIIVSILYKNIYINNIKSLRISIREIEEFEKDNIQ